MILPENERIEDPCEEMARLAEAFLPLKKWNFRESTRFVTTSPKVIYDSELCRVKFIWDGWETYTGNTMSILYGKLHAPNDKYQMIQNGEECYCWHRIELALHFLDGNTPKYAAQNVYSHDLLEQFYESEYQKKFHRRQPEWLIRMHVVIWEHYAPRLFEVFDLGNPELWKQYREFLRQVYDIKGRSPNIKPSLDKVC